VNASIEPVAISLGMATLMGACISTALSLSSLDRLRASRLLLPRSGLERSDFVPWHRTDLHTGRRVVRSDLPGRGQSDRLSDSSDYVLSQYCSDMNALIAGLGSVEIHWVGTSLGGLIGTVLAAIPGSPICRLVINDIGPYLPWAGLLRLGANLSQAPKSFETIGAAELYLRRVLAPFGELEDEHWRHLTVHSVEWRPERQHYESLCDPGIAHAFRNPWQYSMDLWKYWDAIDIPILVVRGERSDLLTEDVLAGMLRRNRNATAHIVKNCGHAPALIARDQIEIVVAFSLKSSSYENVAKVAGSSIVRFPQKERSR
jgi:pimeloyl-ACP methyl ester carboxylesterase